MLPKNWNKTTFTVNTLSGNWQQAYTDGLKWNSAYTTLTANSANWNSAYTTLTANSANWNSAYTTLTANSANWNNAYTTTNSNSSNWNNTHTTVSANSAKWSSTYSTVTANSANWNSTYTTLNSNSGNWVNTTNPTASGRLTLTNTFVSVSGQLAGSQYSGISAYGSVDRNVVLAAKGTGATVAQIADGTTVGGNNRGTYATDWQKYRAFACQVASGSIATIGGGSSNSASGTNSTISGGYRNTALGSYGTIAGGCCNLVYCNVPSFVGGGANNTAGADGTAIAGGVFNSASSCYSFIGGGYQNTASGYYGRTTVSGGYSNSATHDYATVGGGKYNTASNYHATVGGGCNNTASGAYSTVGGGCGNTASGVYSGILGGRNNNTNNQACAFIIGSGITATQSNTTFVNTLCSVGSVYAASVYDTTGKMMSLGGELWELSKVRPMGAFQYGNASGSAATGYTAGGCTISTTAVSASYGRASLYRGVNVIPGFTGGGILFQYDMAFSVLGCINAGNGGSGIRFIVGGTGGEPTYWDQNALWKQGFGLEFRYLASGSEARLFAHNGTTYSTSNWTGTNVGGQFQTLCQFIVQSDGTGNISAYISTAQGQPPRPSTTATLTLTGGPTTTGPASAHHVDIVAVTNSTGGGIAASSAVVLASYLNANPL